MQALPWRSCWGDTAGTTRSTECKESHPGLIMRDGYVWVGEYGRSEARKWLWRRAGTEVIVAGEGKEQATEPTKHTSRSHSSRLHLARAARQDLHGHIGSILSWAEGGRERQRARWEDLMVMPEEDEATWLFLVVVLALSGPRLAALLFMVSLSQRSQRPCRVEAQRCGMEWGEESTGLELASEV